MSKKFLLIVLLTCSIHSYSQNTISGTVKNVNGENLIGANVIIKNSSIGVSTDTSGTFSLTSNLSFPWVLAFNYFGYHTQEIEVDSSSTDLSVILEEEEFFSVAVVITASRRAEKVQESPASVVIIDQNKLAVSPQIDVTRNLINVPGVQVNTYTAARINLEMRAANALFGTSVFPIMDYRSLVGPGIGTFQTDAAGISNIDLQRIEVVKGPSSALYGPGVASGVVHFITKNPIDHPGTTIELMGGELSTFGANIRHAYSKANKKFGYKINAHYKRGNEFTLDLIEDAEQIAKFKTSVSQPQITNDVVDVTKPLETLLTLEDLDGDNDGNPMQDFWFNSSINTTLEFKPSPDLHLFVSGGYNEASAVFYNDQGEGLANSREFWTQTRLRKGGLFAQFFYVNTDGDRGKNPTFQYQTGLRTPIDRSQIEGQLQYNFDLPDFLDAFINTGIDYRLALSKSYNLVYGRNEDDDNYQIFGAYAQGKFALGTKVDLVLAGRLDQFNFLKQTSFSPRIALVYKPSATNTFRMSFNKASVPPSGLSVNIDFPISTPVPGIFDIWLGGQKNAHTYTNPVIDLTAPGLPDLPFGTPGLPLAIPYAAVNESVIEGIETQLSANPLLAPLLPAIVGFLNDPANIPSGITGVLSGYNIFDGTPLTELVPTASAKLNTVSSFEIGYKGVIGDKVHLNIDLFNHGVKGFTKFTAVAPTYAYTGLENLSEDLGSAVAENLKPFLINVLMGNGQNLAQATATATFLAGQIGSGYAQGGDVFENTIAPLTSIFGAVESDLVPQGDGITHTAAGYRSFANEKRDHWGVDAGLEFFASSSLSFFANYSWLSQVEWIPGRENDDNLPFSSFLNAPKNRYRIGLNYSPPSGITGSFSFQHDDSFFADFGQFSGNTEERNLVDASLGYAFKNGLALNLSANNLFNNEYRPYPNFPKIGRRIVLTIRYHFNQTEL